MKQGEISTYILSCRIRESLHRRMADKLGWDIDFHLRLSAGQIMTEAGRSEGHIRQNNSAVDQYDDNGIW